MKAAAAVSEAEAFLSGLFKSRFKTPPDSIVALKGDGSNRGIFRLHAKGRSAIGVRGPDRRENAAFLGLSKHFRAQKLAVPEIYAEDLDAGIYLEEDFGDETLFDHLSKNRSPRGPSPETIEIYRKAVLELPRFQIEGGKTLDYNLCSPRSSFDKRSMLWDLNHFKYYFLTLSRVPFDEQGLEEDFDRFSDFLLNAERGYFLYRDFQSRNIMVQKNAPRFIDYQGGRRGALQYDVASLLFDAKADLSRETREELLSVYFKAVSERLRLDRRVFLRFYPAYVLIRVLQALGAYGLRGFYERKSHFLQSIPYALKNIAWLFDREDLGVELPVLRPLLERLAASRELQSLGVPKTLTVRVRSFSYAAGIPRDDRGHGGGFVFDCRALPNPGRDPRFAAMTGLDPAVSSTLERDARTRKFLAGVFTLVDQSVGDYLKRGFSELSVAFGCTGGRHRSVFCAEALSKRLREYNQVEVEVRHLGLGSF